MSGAICKNLAINSVTITKHGEIIAEGYYCKHHLWSLFGTQTFSPEIHAKQIRCCVHSGQEIPLSNLIQHEVR